MATVHDRLGGRVIELFIPFETQGRKIEAITLKPICFDHVLRWQQGNFQSSLALLVALSGESESVIRMLRYPDADRVLDAMMAYLPEAIRQDVTNGVIPKPLAPPIQANGPLPPSEMPLGLHEEAEAPEPFAGLEK